MAKKTRITGDDLLKEQKSTSTVRAGTFADQARNGSSSSAGSPTTTGVVTGNDVLKERAQAYQKTSAAYTGGSSGNASARVTGNDLLQSYSDEVKKYEESYRSYENYLGKYTKYQDKYADYYSRDAIQSRLDSSKKLLEDQTQRQKAQSALSRYGQYMTSEQRQGLKKYASGERAACCLR